MFWSIFEKLCAERGVTPNGIAKLLEFSNATTTKWKNGSTPSGKSLQKLADYFGVSIDYLLGNAEPASQEDEFMSLFSELSSEDRNEIIRLMLEKKNKK